MMNKIKKIGEIIENYTKVLSKIDWEKDESLIVLHQCIYRLFALFNSEFYVLHGSAVVTPKGRTITFGDDGKSIGKTTSAFEVARHSKKWIADEFVLYRNGVVYANGEYPIHFKDGSKEYFKWMKRKFRNIIFPKKEGFKIVKDAKLDTIVCPVLSGKASIKELKGEEARWARRTTAFAHIAKLLYPSLDRFSIFTGENSQDTMIKDLTVLIDRFPDFPDEIPIYEMRIKSFRDIIPLLKKAKLYS